MQASKTMFVVCSLSCLIFGLISTTEAGLLPAGAPFGVAPVAAAAAVPVNEVDPHPQYAFAYNVQDALTGDSKSQQEVRDGEIVRGSYSVLDADGSLRTVFYTADPVNGFNAVVQRGPVPVAVAPARPVAPAAAFAAAPPAFPVPARLF